MNNVEELTVSEMMDITGGSFWHDYNDFIHGFDDGWHRR